MNSSLLLHLNHNFWIKFSRASRVPILMLCLMIFGSSFAQESFDIQEDPFANLTPQSPTTAAITKYGKVPVSLYTGTMNFSIPVYTLPARHLSMPINLNYHSGGLKVADHGSMVGLGWSINAGGAISREVRGIADEWPGGGYYDMLESDHDWLDNMTIDKWIEVEAGNLDTEPDIYHFNFMGLSGSFFIDSNGELVTVPVSTLKFIETPFTQEGNKWVIRDGAGNIYHFGGVNGTEVTDFRFGGYKYVKFGVPIAWYLTKVTTPDQKDWIEFSYKQKNQTLRTIQEFLDISNGNDDPCAGGDIPCPANSVPLLTPLSQREVRGKTILEEIKTSKGTVRFLTSGRLVDNQNGLIKLDSIVVKDDLDKFVRKFTFAYQETGNQRLFLNSLSESDHLGFFVKTHSFDYHLPTQFPKWNSKARDIYGFYNGSFATSLLVKSELPDGFKHHSNTERAPSASAMKVGTLNEITYPTGGSTSIEYEPHDSNGKLGAGLRVTRVTDNDGLTSGLNEKRYEYGAGTRWFNPNYATISYTHAQYCEFSWTPFEHIARCNRLTNSSIPNGDQSTFQGSYVGYEEVTEHLGPKKSGSNILGENGKRVLTFEHKTNLGGENWTGVPYPVFYQHEIGMIKKEEIYDGSGDSGAKKFQKVYHYDNDSDLVQMNHSEAKGMVYKRSVRGAYLRSLDDDQSIHTYLSNDPVDKINFFGELSSDHVPPYYTFVTPYGEFTEQTDFPQRAKWLVGKRISLNFDTYIITSSEWNSSNTGINLSMTKVIYSSVNHFPLQEIFQSYEYNLETNRRFLSHTIEKSYEGGQTMETRVDYKYDQSNFLVSEQTQELSSGKEQKTTYKYPASYTGVVYDDMLNLNMVNNLIESRVTVKEEDAAEKYVSVQKNIYSRFAMAANTDEFEVEDDDQVSTTIPRLWKSQFRPMDKPLSSSLPSFETAFEVKTYDVFGNITLYENDLTGIGTSLAWDSKGNYLNTRSVIGSSSLTQTTSYAFKPLFGVSSITDLNGLTLNFSYDLLGRLTKVKNQNGHLVESYEYSLGSPSTGGNMVRTFSYQTDLINTVQIGGSYGKAIVSTSYFDGLGRGIQQNIYRGSPNTDNISDSDQNKDLISVTEYDQYGRVDKAYLPFQSSQNSGSFRAGDVASEIVSNRGSHPYSQSTYESSPLSRVVKAGYPGISGTNSRAIEHAYSFNTKGNDNDDDNIPRYEVDGSGVLLMTSGGYSENDLYKRMVEDENNHRIWEFSDRSGRVVCKKVENSGGDLVTHYIYDDLGRLRFVLQPEAEGSVSGPYFAYTYYGTGNIRTKSIPGGGTTTMTYHEDSNQLATSTDANGTVQEFIYDDLNRLTEVKVDGVWQRKLYYDDYDAVGSYAPYSIVIDHNAQQKALNISDQLENGLTADNYKSVNGQLTWEVGKTLSAGGSQTIVKTYYYDDAYRPIQTLEQLPEGGHSRISYNYETVSGRVISTKTIDKPTNGEWLKFYHNYTYDHQSRLTTLNYVTGSFKPGQESTIGGLNLVENQYNEIGELAHKKVNSETGNLLQKVDYEYNIRGWLTKINNPESLGGDLFGMELLYDNNDFDNQDCVSAPTIIKPIEFVVPGLEQFSTKPIIIGQSKAHHGVNYKLYPELKLAEDRLLTSLKESNAKPLPTIRRSDFSESIIDLSQELEPFEISSECSGTVLFVSRDHGLTPNEELVKQKLQELGLTVVNVRISSLSDSDFDGINLIVVSSFIGSSDASMLVNRPIPLINMRYYNVMEGLKIGEPKYQTRSSFTIENSQHTIANGSSGAVYSANNRLYYMINTGSDAKFIGHMDGDPSKQVLVYYNQTDQMMGGFSAPAKRVGFFGNKDMEDEFTSDAWALFQGSVKWSLNCGSEPTGNNNPTLEDINDKTNIVNSNIGTGQKANGNDPDTGDLLAYSHQNLPPGILIDQNTGEFSGTPTTIGDYTVTITVTDQAEAFASRTFIWSIIGAGGNAHPTIEQVDPQNNNEGQSPIIQLVGDDQEGGVSYLISGLPSGLTMDTQGKISGTIASGAANNSPYNVEVTVTDDDGLQASMNFTWAVNSSPSTDQCSGTVLFVSRNHSLTPKEELVEQKLQEQGLSVVNVRISSLSDSDFEGINLIVVSSYIGSSDASMLVNRPIPLINMRYYNIMAGLKIGQPNNQTKSSFTIVDSEHTIANGSSGAVYTSNDRIYYMSNTGSDAKFIGHMDGDPSKRVLVYYNATDRMMDNFAAPAKRVGFFGNKDMEDKFTSDAWALFKGAVKWSLNCGSTGNIAPVLNPISDKSSEVDVSLDDQPTQKAIGNDPDGNVITYSATGLPPGITIDASSGEFSGTPTQAGTFENVTIRLEDSNDASVTESFTWTIGTEQVLVITNPGNQNNEDGEEIVPFSIQVNQTGVTFEASGLPNGLSINSADGEISGTVNDEDDTYSVTITAIKDGQESVITFVWNITSGATDVTFSEQYNGNISAIKWNSKSSSSFDEVEEPHAYTFDYDQANRLSSAGYVRYNGSSWCADEGAYSVEDIRYYKNGNIRTLNRRYDQTPIDILSYTYNSNYQLKAVTDAGTAHESGVKGFEDDRDKSITDFAYDSNGNLKSDLNKGITDIIYNYLNLPVKIIMGPNRIEYDYDAQGSKIVKRVYEGQTLKKTTRYRNGIQYEDGELDFFAHPEGRVVWNDGNYEFEYNLTDHLGNVRVSYKEDSNGDAVAIQSDHYYPFGMRFQSYTDGKQNAYLYNGKELQSDHNLDWYDYGARMYDPAIGRWHVVDPVAGAMSNWSPYSYAFDNPIRFIDKDGLYPIEIITRSYAPFKSFGPGFARYHGDDRGHSLDKGASSRTSATINFDTETNGSSVRGSKSLSYKTGQSPESGTYSNTYVENRSDGGNLDVHSFGNNADQPGSWDIDQFTKLSVTIDGDIETDHILNVSGAISGDDFPNQESIISDTAGNSLWLGNSETAWGKATGPTMDLARENEDAVQIKVNISINVNSDGVFQSVNQGDKTISIGDWNKQYE